MTDNDELKETKRGDQQDLEQQQQDLFRELSQEQTEAEQGLKGETASDDKAAQSK